MPFWLWFGLIEYVTGTSRVGSAFFVWGHASEDIMAMRQHDMCPDEAHKDGSDEAKISFDEYVPDHGGADAGLSS